MNGIEHQSDYVGPPNRRTFGLGEPLRLAKPRLEATMRAAIVG